MIQAARGSRSARAGSDAGGAQRCETRTSVSLALADVVTTLERACEELFTVVPFLGDQATGARVNASVDEVVDALRALRAEADDLRRVIALADRQRGGR